MVSLFSLYTLNNSGEIYAFKRVGETDRMRFLHQHMKRKEKERRGGGGRVIKGQFIVSKQPRQEVFSPESCVSHSFFFFFLPLTVQHPFVPGRFSGGLDGIYWAIAVETHAYNSRV